MPLPPARPVSEWPDASGRFGAFGGQFVPETLSAALGQLCTAYAEARIDPAFWTELDGYLSHYVGRPSPLYFARRMSERLGGAKVLFKREDLNHTGAHKINNTLGQAMLARRMGKRRVIADTASRRPPRRPCSVWSARSIWGLRMCVGSSSMSIAWNCWVPGLCRLKTASGR